MIVYQTSFSTRYTRNSTGLFILNLYKYSTRFTIDYIKCVLTVSTENTIIKNKLLLFDHLLKIFFY